VMMFGGGAGSAVKEFLYFSYHRKSSGWVPAVSLIGVKLLNQQEHATQQHEHTTHICILFSTSKPTILTLQFIMTMLLNRNRHPTQLESSTQGSM
jgi:hypothetical protein